MYNKLKAVGEWEETMDVQGVHHHKIMATHLKSGSGDFIFCPIAPEKIAHRLSHRLEIFCPVFGIFLRHLS
jgi:hypothetical protein